MLAAENFVTICWKTSTNTTNIQQDGKYNFGKVITYQGDEFEGTVKIQEGSQALMELFKQRVFQSCCKHKGKLCERCTISERNYLKRSVPICS